MEKLTLISSGLFITADILAVLSLILPDWIVSEVGGETRLGLLQCCVTLYGRYSQCHTTSPPNLSPEWTATLICIIAGCVCVTTTVILFIISLWNVYVISYARWLGFAAMVAFCLAAVIFPMGFTIDTIGGQPYQLPSSHHVGISYIFFVLSLWITVISELFAGKVCMPHF